MAVLEVNGGAGGVAAGGGRAVAAAAEAADKASEFHVSESWRHGTPGTGIRAFKNLKRKGPGG